MNLLLLLLTLPSVPARAEWSCVNREGWLMSCASSPACRKFYPHCVAAKDIPPECAVSHCRASIDKDGQARIPKADQKADLSAVKDYSSSAADPAPKPEGKVAAKPEPRPEPKKLAEPGPISPNELEGASPAVIAERKMYEFRALVRAAAERQAHARVSEKRASGLTAAEEARLFGGASEPAPDPHGPVTAKPWSAYMSEADHKHLLDELRSQPLRYELRARVAAQPTDASLEEKEAASLATALVNEAEKRSGGAEKDSGSMKPLTPEDAFGLGDDDVRSLEKR